VRHPRKRTPDTCITSIRVAKLGNAYTGQPPPPRKSVIYAALGLPPGGSAYPPGGDPLDFPDTPQGSWRVASVSKTPTLVRWSGAEDLSPIGTQVTARAFSLSRHLSPEAHARYYFPATSEREKISFHQLNKKTGHRVKYRKVDAESGDEVDSADIIKGYEVGKGGYIELDPEELEAVAIESKRTIDIDEFVPRDEIDELYLNNPYYIAPDGEVGQQAFAVIREAILKEGMVAIGKVVFTSREHLLLKPAARDCWVSLCDILMRYGTKPIISMTSPTRSRAAWPASATFVAQVGPLAVLLPPVGYAQSRFS
jgi:Ku70/Ku80 beta-barrel domain